MPLNSKCHCSCWGNSENGWRQLPPLTGPRICLGYSSHIVPAAREIPRWWLTQKDRESGRVKGRALNARNSRRRPGSLTVPSPLLLDFHPPRLPSSPLADPLSSTLFTRRQLAAREPSPRSLSPSQHFYDRRRRRSPPHAHATHHPRPVPPRCRPRSSTHAPIMQSDDVIWSVINAQFCSYKVKFVARSFHGRLRPPPRLDSQTDVPIDPPLRQDKHPKLLPKRVQRYGTLQPAVLPACQLAVRDRP
jgi:hypothetical protein